ncbi:ABC transporter ATP-binding protein [Starkeya sp. ORNL1]|uniref:ABC transporter ATP-binding protein n=1 Tax=Starkeya sp. ORNL1 TaxID=2709380 RepID=UPI0014635323|nr:ABC transporter ATP-binding protein [Starkeya sp. ORNL1]QJP16126.1 ABC transporter ATP-binding protein [Starkeya sp. ORNL1]
MAKLSINSVGRDYGGVTAVHDFSIGIEDGEFVSLLGPSGCGKTTMLRMIAGFMSPSRGNIVLNGETISSPERVVPPERRRMSMIFQSYAIWPNMTVWQNVAFGLELRKVPAAEMKQRIGHMLEVVHLAPYADRYPAELSGGQQQRVALARAIVVKPEVLLLDEPLSNLDANLRDEMRIEIRRMHNEFKITTVYVTHDQGEAMVASDRIVVMSGGHIEQVDTPQRIYSAPATRFVASFIGRTNFLTGTLKDGKVDFGGISVPAPLLGGVPASGGKVVVSARPHSIRLGATEPQPALPASIVAAGDIVERAYFGDHWDYAVRLSDQLVITVASEPYEAHAVGERVWLTLDAGQMSVIPET